MMHPFDKALAEGRAAAKTREQRARWVHLAGSTRARGSAGPGALLRSAEWRFHAIG